MGLGALGIVGGLASTGLQMYGMSQQAKAQPAAAKYNNQLAEREARNVELQTTEGIRRQRISNAEAMSEQRAQLAGSGVQTDTGTPLLLQGETASRLQLSISDAARSAAIQTASIRAQGKMGIWEADVLAGAAKTQMLATGVQGIASAYGQYRTAKYTGTR